MALQHRRHPRAQPASRPAVRARRRVPTIGLLVPVLLLGLAASPARAESAGPEEGSAWNVPLGVCDALFVRPVGFASVLVGTLFYGVAGPIGAAYGRAGEVWRLYVKKNFDFTFRRRLGDFETSAL